MPKLLHIAASPREDRSISSRLAGQFLLTFTDKGWEIDRLPLWEVDLPPFDGEALKAKYAALSGRRHTSGEDEAWREIERFVLQLAAADRVLISTPMWNLGLPYRLKHWFDLVTQPGLSFSFDPGEGYSPLLAPKPVTVILASAGDFSDGTSWGRPDLASPYLLAALKFLGQPDVEIVRAGPTIGAEAATRAAFERAANRLSAIAATAA